MNTSTPMHTLSEIFGFTDDDVLENRKGHLGINQRKRLGQARLLWLIGLMVALVCWGVILLNPQKSSNDNMILSAICILAALVLGYKAYQVHRDLKEKIVSRSLAAPSSSSAKSKTEVLGKKSNTYTA